MTDNHSIPVLSNRMPSNGYFPFPAHGEPGQGSADRQSSVLAGNLSFCGLLFADVLPFSMLQQVQIAAPCPVSSETGFFLQPAGGDEVLDGTLDGGFGQTCVAGNGWDERETGAVLVAPLAEVEVDGYCAGREVLLVECIEEAHVTPPAPVGGVGAAAGADADGCFCRVWVGSGTAPNPPLRPESRPPEFRNPDSALSASDIVFGLPEAARLLRRRRPRGCRVPLPDMLSRM